MVYDVSYDLARFEEYNVLIPGSMGSATRGAGIVVAASQPRLLAEEAPYAYKDVSQVVKACEDARLAGRWLAFDRWEW
jgi:hypothetical protein